MVNSSHGQLITQSTRHKLAHNKATSRNFFYLYAGQVAPRNSAQNGVIMASEHTRYMQCRAVRFGYLGLMSLAMARMISDSSYVET